MGQGHIKDKSPEELLEAMVGVAEPGSAVGEQIKIAAIVRAARQLEEATREAAASSASLGRSLNWLTLAVAAATAVGAFAACWQAFA